MHISKAGDEMLARTALLNSEKQSHPSTLSRGGSCRGKAGVPLRPRRMHAWPPAALVLRLNTGLEASWNQPKCAVYHSPGPPGFILRGPKLNQVRVDPWFSVIMCWSFGSAED